MEKHRQARAFIYRLHFGRPFRTVIIFLLPILFVFTAYAQEEATVDSSVDPGVVETIAKPAAVLYESDNRRDPFLHITPSRMAGNVDDEEVPRGNPPPGISGTFIEKAGFEGTMIRSGDRRIAIIRSADNQAHFLREGDRLFDGYIKTIEADSVVFIRETLLKSGKTLIQEVTKRLRKS